MNTADTSSITLASLLSEPRDDGTFAAAAACVPGPAPALLTAVELSARQATLPKIAKLMLSRLWKLSGICAVCGPGVVTVAAAAVGVGAGCGDEVTGTVVTVDTAGGDWESETWT